MNLVTLCNQEYLIGLETLLYSISKYPNPFEKVYILTDDLKFDGFLDWPVECINVNDFQPYEYPIVSTRLQWNWHKLKAWLLPDGEYTFLDADMLCKDSTLGVHGMPDFSAVLDQGHENHFNLGFFVFRPSPLKYAQLHETIELLRDTGSEFKLAEQTVLNYTLLTHNWKRYEISENWNMMNKNFYRRPDRWKPEEAVFIHYVGARKPWDTWNEIGPDALWVKERREYENRIGQG